MASSLKKMRDAKSATITHFSLVHNRTASEEMTQSSLKTSPAPRHAGVNTPLLHLFDITAAADVIDDDRLDCFSTGEIILYFYCPSPKKTTKKDL